MSDEDTTYNSKPLDELLKVMKSKSLTAKIGILGQKDSRTTTEKNGTTSNATIGAAHEFGTSKLPQRSFLRMPIAEMLPKKLEEAGALDENVLKQIIKNGFKNYVEKLAILGVSCVIEAFQTEGYGTWKDLEDNYKNWKKSYAKKGNTSAVQILTLTGQLRDSISYEITKS